MRCDPATLYFKEICPAVDLFGQLLLRFGEVYHDDKDCRGFQAKRFQHCSMAAIILGLSSQVVDLDVSFQTDAVADTAIVHSSKWSLDVLSELELPILK